jgi:hypothetical protein
LKQLIAQRAYEICENQGQPQGCDLIHWHEAELEIMNCVKQAAETSGDWTKTQLPRSIRLADYQGKFLPELVSDQFKSAEDISRWLESIGEPVRSTLHGGAAFSMAVTWSGYQIFCDGFVSKIRE